MSLLDQHWCPASAQVTVLQARGLRVKGKSGTNDAFAVMQVGKEKYQTSVVEKSVAPVWKEEAAFDLPGGGERSTLHVHVLHRALVGPDKLLGQAVIDLLQLSEDRTRSKTEWFKLLDKAGKSDKDRGEVLLDVQFMRNNMTASMFDLSAACKSRSRLGKFKDKVRGKKKESDAASTVVQSFTQVLTDSEEEGKGDGEVTAGKEEKKKKHKIKSFFSPKSNLQRNMSQSMSVLPAKNSPLSSSQSSGLNVDSSEGKKKFKFLMHKRSGSSDSKDSTAGSQKHGSVEQSNLCINGSHVYCEEPQLRTSRIGSNFSLASSGHGSMEDVPDSSPPSVDSLRTVRQYSPWTEEEEEEEEEAEVENNIQDMDDRRTKEEMVSKQELEMLAEEKRRLEEEERMQIQEERHRREEEERIKREEERAEGERRRREDDERLQREEEERERLAEEKRKLEEQERRRVEEENIQREEEERIRMDEERAQENRRRQEEEKERLVEEKRRLEEEERRIAEESRKEEEERARREEVRAQEEKRKQELEERVRRQEEDLQEKRRLEEKARRQMEEEERNRKEEKRRQVEEEKKRKENEEYQRLVEEIRKQQEEERKRIEEKRRQVEEEEEKTRKEKEEYERLVEEKRIQQEEERKRIEEKRRQVEEEKTRKEKEEYERLVEEKRIQQEEERKMIEEARRKKEEEAEEQRRSEEEKRRTEEEQRQREEERRIKEEERARKEKEEYERSVEEKRRREEEERKQKEEERIRIEEERAEEEERARKAKEEIERSAEKTKLEELAKTRMEEEQKISTVERIRMEEKDEEEEACKQDKEASRGDAEEQEKRKNVPNVGHTAAGQKSSVAVECRGPAEVLSTNPFDEPPVSSAGPDRCQFPEATEGNETVSADEKDIVSHREKRQAPRPPVRTQAGRNSQGEKNVSTLHLSKISKQNKDKAVITGSVLPRGTLQVITPLSNTPTNTKNTQSLSQCDTTKGTSKAAKQTKRPAPSKPHSVEEESSPDNSIPHRRGSEGKKVPAVLSLNPFEDEKDENELTAQDDATAARIDPSSIRQPAAVSQTPDDKDAVSQAKNKSSKVARAPLPPAKTAATRGTLNQRNPDHETDGADISPSINNAAEACDLEATRSVSVQESPLQDSQTGTLQHAREEAGGKKEGPTLRRLQPVKPLNPLEQQFVSAGRVEKEKPARILSGRGGEVQVNDTGLKGPYSLLTQEELISLVLKQENQLSERDKKISQLEQYIDNLLVRVMEEQPSILMSMNSLNKAV